MRTWFRKNHVLEWHWTPRPLSCKIHFQVGDAKNAVSSSIFVTQNGIAPSRGARKPSDGTDQENSTSFDQMAGAIWRSVTLGFFLLFLWKQLSKFVFFLFFLRFLPRFWDRSGKRSQSLQIMGAIWRDWYGCVLPRVSLEIIFQKFLL